MEVDNLLIVAGIVFQAMRVFFHFQVRWIEGLMNRVFACVCYTLAGKGFCLSISSEPNEWSTFPSTQAGFEMVLYLL